jgi:hypothetical protein
MPRSIRIILKMSPPDRDSNKRKTSMARASLQSVADEQILYLTTIGRTRGLAREIEIWFVVCRGRFYLFAETGESAGWVKNIRRNPKVTVRIRRTPS